jgi:glyoxylase-like metal-dependent hydrolase (beta-lactamase superfamily II)
MGDDYVRYGFPFIDVLSGGSVQGMIAACQKVTDAVPADVKVIPGHGDLSNLEEVRDYIKMLQETSAAVQKAIASGKSVEQMKQDKILAPWEQKYAGKFITANIFIETLYNSLTNAKNASFVQHN